MSKNHTHTKNKKTTELPDQLCQPLRLIRGAG